MNCWQNHNTKIEQSEFTGPRNPFHELLAKSQYKNRAKRIFTKLSDTRLKLQYREFSFAHNIHFSQHIVVKFSTKHGSITGELSWISEVYTAWRHPFNTRDVETAVTGRCCPTIVFSCVFQGDFNTSSVHMCGLETFWTECTRTHRDFMCLLVCYRYRRSRVVLGKATDVRVIYSII